MAIDLDFYPKPLSYPKTLKLWGWLLLLLVFLAIGVIATFFLGFYYPLSNLGFLVGCIGIPVSSWVITGICVFLYIIYREGYVDKWNYEYESHYYGLVAYGQRPLYVLFHTLYCEYGYDNNAQKIADQSVSIQTRCPNEDGKGQAIAYSCFPNKPGIMRHNFEKRIDELFGVLHNDLFYKIKPELTFSYPIHLRFSINVSLSEQQLMELWENHFGTQFHFASVEIIHTQQDELFVEQWLDNDNNESSLLLVIAIHLFSEPVENQGETMTTFLLAGSMLINDDKLQALLPDSLQNRVAIHRPEIGRDLSLTIEKGVLWGAQEESITSLNSVWYSQVSAEDNVEIMEVLNEQGIDVANVYHLEHSIGYSGKMSYWNGLALAVERSKNTKGKQLLICQSDQLSVSTVSYCV